MCIHARQGRRKEGGAKGRVNRSFSLSGCFSSHLQTLPPSRSVSRWTLPSSPLAQPINLFRALPLPTPPFPPALLPFFPLAGPSFLFPRRGPNTTPTRTFPPSLSLRLQLLDFLLFLLLFQPTRLPALLLLIQLLLTMRCAMRAPTPSTLPLSLPPTVPSSPLTFTRAALRPCPRLLEGVAEKGQGEGGKVIIARRSESSRLSTRWKQSGGADQWKSGAQKCNITISVLSISSTTTTINTSRGSSSNSSNTARNDRRTRVRVRKNENEHRERKKRGKRGCGRGRFI